MTEVATEGKTPSTQPSGMEMGPMSGSLASTSPFSSTGKVKQETIDRVNVILRLLCLASSMIGLSFMVTAKQSASLSLNGFEFPVSSQWSYADSFEYLVGVSAAVSVYTLLLLLISMPRLRKKVVVIPSQKYAWIVYVGDQIFAYAMMSAGSAASGVTNLNRAGIRNTGLPDFCKPLHNFCNHVAASILFTLLSFLLLAASVVLDIIWLTCY